MTRSEDTYSRIDYRRFVAWPKRIEREWPFLERVLATAPAKRVLDLGCGSGEHSRFLAAHGFEVVGVDASESMLEKAREGPPPPNLRFVLGDLADLETLVEGSFGAALCLGNTLPHVREPGHLRRALASLRRRLLPGAPFCFQILNYEKIFATGQRSLPLNFRDDPEGELVFLRLMTPRPDGSVLFNPTTLRLRPGEDPPLEVLRGKNVELRGWRREELEELLAEAGFAARTLYGGMREQPYEPLGSPDLVMVAR